MDPSTHNDPGSSASTQPDTELGALHMPPADQSGQSDAAPVAPPPATATSWLPPSVPVQSANGAQVGGQMPASTVPAPAIADDGDVIEREWVVKAKQIVERTRHDPYNQTKELHKFKSEYLKKRYNKTIEAVDE